MAKEEKEIKEEVTHDVANTEDSANTAESGETANPVEPTEPVAPVEPPEDTIAKVETVEVKLNLGVAESIGEHTIFMGGKTITFNDGIATVSPQQAELLRKHGYIE